MPIGTALFSMRSELRMRSLFTSLFSRSYSTYYSQRGVWHKKTVSQNTKLVHSPTTFTKWTNQLVVHSQREQSGLGAVQVNPKKKVFDGLVVGVVPAHIRPTRQRAFISLQAEYRHCFSGILRVNKEIKTYMSHLEMEPWKYRFAIHYHSHKPILFHNDSFKKMPT